MFSGLSPANTHGERWIGMTLVPAVAQVSPGDAVAIRVDGLQVIAAVVGDLTELPHYLLASLPSLHVRHFHLAEDVSMPQGVGRGGEGDLGGEGIELNTKY